jgi:MFS family permease
LAKMMAKLRYEDEIDDEVRKIRKEVAEEERLGVASWRELLSDDNQMRYRLMLGITLNIVTQLSGINAIMFYAPDILDTFFTPSQAIVGAFALNLINFLSTFITVWAVDKLGRIKLLLSGGLLMLFALIGCSICATLEQTKTVGWMVLISCSFFIIGFAYSWGPVIWVICSEIFPLRARGKATGLTTTSNWMSATVVGAFFPLASTISLPACFAFFAFFVALGTAEIYLFAPETANRTILEIDESFARHKPALFRINQL